MTHTFIKSGEQYDVGMWLLSFHRPGTHQFTPLVSVGTLRAAIRLTNLLNGGTGNIDATLLRAGVLQAPERAAALQERQDEAMHPRETEGPEVVRRARARAPARHAV